MRWMEPGNQQVFYAIGQHDAIGTSPFAIDALLNPSDTPLERSYAALQQLAPLILAHQGQAAMAGFMLNTDQARVTRRLGNYELEIALDSIFIFKSEIGYGLIIATGPDSFVGCLLYTSRCV